MVLPTETATFYASGCGVKAWETIYTPTVLMGASHWRNRFNGRHLLNVLIALVRVNFVTLSILSGKTDGNADCLPGNALSLTNGCRSYVAVETPWSITMPQGRLAMCTSASLMWVKDR